jgi:hypothetical protein
MRKKKEKIVSAAIKSTGHFSGLDSSNSYSMRLILRVVRNALLGTIKWGEEQNGSAPTS